MPSIKGKHITIILVLLFSCIENKREKFNLINVAILRESNKDSFLILSNRFLNDENLTILERSDLLTQLGHFYSDNSSFDSAFEYHQKAYTLRKEIGDSEAMLNSQASMAYVLFDKGLSDSAIAFYERTIKKRKNKENLTDDYTNLAYLYSKVELNTKAIYCFQRAISLAEELKDSMKKSKICYNLSLFYSNIRNFDLAHQYLNTSQETRVYAEMPGNRINFFLAKAAIYYDQSDFTRSGWFYDSALTYSVLRNLRNDRLYALQGSAAVSENLKNFAEANVYLNWRASLSDSLFSENIQNEIAELEVKYGTERKLKQIFVLNEANAKQTIILIALSIGLILLLVILFFGYKNQQNKRKKILAETSLNINKILEEVNQTKMEAWADGQEKERSRLAAELHDRLGGLLVMASHHFSGIEKKFDLIKKENESAFSDFRKIINNAIIEVRELSKDISSNLVSKLGLANAMMDLKEKIENATALKIHLSIHDAEAKASLVQEIALFRIAQEALNNIMKHALATDVQLSLTGSADSLVLIVEDNGKGFDNSKNTDFAGMGLKSMQKRMLDIAGSLHIDSKPGRGTIVVAEITLTKE